MKRIRSQVAHGLKFVYLVLWIAFYWFILAAVYELMGGAQ